MVLEHNLDIDLDTYNSKSRYGFNLGIAAGGTRPIFKKDSEQISLIAGETVITFMMGATAKLSEDQSTMCKHSV